MKPTFSNEVKHHYFSKIDVMRLKRDYQSNPLKRIGRKREFPFKEDLEYLYLELNFPAKILQFYLDCDEQAQLKWFKALNVERKSDVDIELSRKEFLLLTTGYESPNQNPLVKHHKKESSLRKYGTSHPMKNSDVKESHRKAIQRKYGVSNVSKLPFIQAKKEQTALAHYGVKEISKSPLIKQRKVETCLKNHGVSYPMQNKSIVEKSKQTCLKKYGKEIYAGSSFYKENLKSIMQKQYETKKSNGTLNTSKPEDFIYEKLKLKFPDTIRQFKCERYPFRCDFYIPSLDLFIEYNGFCTHGGHPFNSNDKDDLNKVSVWKQKSQETNFKGKKKSFYPNAIKVWTESDPLKRETALKNKLNWVEFFNEQEFKDWFENF